MKAKTRPDTTLRKSLPSRPVKYSRSSYPARRPYFWPREARA